jgi:lysophospholipid hydrolase
MTDSRTAKAFLASSLFASVDPEELVRLAGQAAELSLSAGETLFRQGDTADAVYLLVDGQLQALSENGEGEESFLGSIDSGEPVGELAVLLGGRRSATIRATASSHLARIEVDILKPWFERSPELQQALEGLARERLRRNQLSAIIRRYFGALDEPAQEELAESLEWLSLSPGEILFRHGDPGESLYLVVSGQLWAVGEDEMGNEVPIATLGEQDVVGEMGLLSHDSRSAGVVAAQETTLVRLSRTTFEALSSEYPNLMLTITRELIGKLRRTQRSRSASQGGSREIAVVFAEPGLADDRLIRALSSKLSSRSMVVGRQDVQRHLGRGDLADARPGDPDHVGLSVWLEEQSTIHDVVFYLTESLQGDGRTTEWTRHCLTRADEVLVVADSRGDERPQDLERALYEERQTSIGLRTMPRTRLLLLHDGGVALPARTERWLQARSPDGCFHLRRDSESDLGRVARILDNRAVGLVLGGHGAGTVAQIGALKALEEAGVPQDILAGSGMGALVAALKARGMTVGDMESLDWQRIITAKNLDRISRELFGDSRIEDLWHTFSCSTMNLSRQDLSIHRRGDLGKAVMAAVAMPGLHSPVAFGDELHMDGGLGNQYPGEILSQQAAHCISVDSVSANGLRRGDLSKVGSKEGGRDGFWRRLVRRVSPGNGESKEDHALLMEAVMASGSRTIERLRESMDVRLLLPVGDAATSETLDPKALMNQGYRQTVQQLSALSDEELITRLAT